MHSVIGLEDKLSTLLKRFPSIVEIYAPMDFTLSDEGKTLYVLHNSDRRDYTLYKLINKLLPCKLVFTTDVFSALFQGNRIVWRKGRWYL